MALWNIFGSEKKKQQIKRKKVAALARKTNQGLTIDEINTMDMETIDLILETNEFPETWTPPSQTRSIPSQETKDDSDPVEETEILGFDDVTFDEPVEEELEEHGVKQSFDSFEEESNDDEI